MSDPAEQTNPPTPEPAPPVAPPASTAWAAPSAPPFGAPPSPAQPAGHQSGMAPAAPGVYAPPVGYVLPAGYGAQPPASGPERRGLGVVAFVLAAVATVGAALGGAIAAFAIGLGAGRESAMRPFTGDFDWAVLAPVRNQVLLAEVSFWLGTVLGVWALVQGIIALVKDRGRPWAVVAIVVAALGPIVFFVVLQGFLTAGLDAGSGIGG